MTRKKIYHLAVISLLMPFTANAQNSGPDKKWNLQFQGDIGGFGFFDTFTYLFNPYIGYRFSSLFEAGVGYRVFFIDKNYEDGNDAVKFTFYGPQLGIALHF